MSEYAILQKDLEKPPVEGLVRAFKSLTELVDLDAASMSADGYGVLVDHLSQEHANILFEALTIEGINTEIVDQETLLKLPCSKQLKRIDCLEDHLIVYDALGHPTELGWEHVVMVAGGIVDVVEFEAREKKRVVYRAAGISDKQFVVPIILHDINIKEVNKLRLILEVFVDTEPGRFHLVGHECNYCYMGDRVGIRYMDSFATMMQDITKYATSAIMNRGATSMRNDGQTIYKYPTWHSFEEEIIWLLWKQGYMAQC